MTRTGTVLERKRIKVMRSRICRVTDPFSPQGPQREDTVFSVEEQLALLRFKPAFGHIGAVVGGQNLLVLQGRENSTALNLPSGPSSTRQLKSNALPATPLVLVCVTAFHSAFGVATHG